MTWFTNLPSFDIFYIILIASGIMVTSWRREELDSGLKHLPILCFLYLVLEVSTAYAASFMDNTHFVYHIFSPFDYLVYCVIFYEFFKSKSWGIFIVYSIPVFLIISVAISFWDGLAHTTSKLFLIRGCVMLFLCLTYFKVILTESNALTSSTLPQMFWFCVAVVFFFAGKLFISGLMDVLIKTNMQKARSVYYSGYIFNYILFSAIIMISLLSKPS